ncbi:acylphosphatase [Luteibacter sp. UNC138MFCol5.1]|uniref:acylphosphatase n=1 Tax=Luteibacter sp. UNC138MFCol5.1 TaxID=1502774 RepID=UPI0008C2B267|nr:acylphosphatase [Luteibacter sp. UNC138MFCol5.1]SEO85340.1 acylphosphatase [Luteibacter sp. UNC138MFCol5.1]
MQATRFVVRGKVQGVFFRASARERALGLGLTGFAKNLSDGSVEVVVYGERGAIESMEEWLRDGPEHARVDELYREELSVHELPEAFDIR